MVDRAYVVDIAVLDVEEAAADFQRILGIEPLVTDHYDPSGQMRQRHFAVGGLNAIGLQSVPDMETHGRNFVARRLRDRGEGAYLVGFIVDDVAARQSDLAARGVGFAIAEPVEYEAGRMVVTRPSHGTVVEFAEHFTFDETVKWRTMAESAPDRRVRQAYVVDLAVDDLDAAREVFERALGAPSVDSADVPEPLPGDGVVIPADGIYGFGITTIGSRGALAPTGEGVYCIGFVVDDVDDMRRHLDRIGVPVRVEPFSFAHGRSLITEQVHGVHLQFTEHSQEGTARWRALAG